MHVSIVHFLLTKEAKVSKLLLLFDLDETLIPNSYKYSRQTWRCGTIIAEVFAKKGPHPLDVLKKQAEIDIDLVKSRGLLLDRFPLSWVDTYVWFCKELGLKPNKEVKDRLFNTASQFKRGPFRAYAGAKKVLRQLRLDGHKMHVITSGVESLQMRKMRDAGLVKFFDSIHVMNLEKKAIMASLVGERTAEAVMIGDSKRSDIKPAVDLGITSVWIPGDGWSYANAKVDPDFEISSIRELPGVIERLLGKKR